MDKEHILCAANYYDDGIEHTYKPINITTGYVICGHRHHNCIDTFAKIVGFPYTEEAHKLHRTEVQGFLTSRNRFVSREEALVIAIESNQVKDMDKVRGNSLYSEDLY